MLHLKILYTKVLVICKLYYMLTQIRIIISNKFRVLINFAPFKKNQNNKQNPKVL